MADKVPLELARQCLGVLYNPARKQRMRTHGISYDKLLDRWLNL